MDDSWLVTEAVSSSSPLLSFLLSFLPFSPVILKANKQTKTQIIPNDVDVRRKVDEGTRHKYK